MRTLVFNLNSTSTAGTELALGATPSVLFSGTNSLTFDFWGAGMIANGTQYTLMTTTVAGGGEDGSVFEGITLSGSVITSGFNLNFVNGTMSYGGSYLVLVADGSGL